MTAAAATAPNPAGRLSLIHEIGTIYFQWLVRAALDGPEAAP